MAKVKTADMKSNATNVTCRMIHDEKYAGFTNAVMAVFSSQTINSVAAAMLELTLKGYDVSKFTEFKLLKYACYLLGRSHIVTNYSTEVVQRVLKQKSSFDSTVGKKKAEDFCRAFALGQKMSPLGNSIVKQACRHYPDMLGKCIIELGKLDPRNLIQQML